jgi:hypothetical protein
MTKREKQQQRIAEIVKAFTEKYVVSGLIGWESREDGLYAITEGSDNRNPKWPNNISDVLYWYPKTTWGCQHSRGGQRFIYTFKYQDKEIENLAENKQFIYAMLNRINSWLLYNYSDKEKRNIYQESKIIVSQEYKEFERMHLGKFSSVFDSEYNFKWDTYLNLQDRFPNFVVLDRQGNRITRQKEVA